jgi:hypothetical protein
VFCARVRFRFNLHFRFCRDAKESDFKERLGVSLSAVIMANQGTIKKKRINLSLETKIRILDEVEAKKMNKTKIGEKFGIPKSTLSTILKP